MHRLKRILDNAVDHRYRITADALEEPGQLPVAVEALEGDDIAADQVLKIGEQGQRQSVRSDIAAMLPATAASARSRCPLTVTGAFIRSPSTVRLAARPGHTQNVG